MDSWKIAWKNWLREIAPNPFNQASLENISSGADQLSRKKILFFCDNEGSVKVIKSGSSKDAFMQNCLRELCYMAAVFQFDIRAKHILDE
jgi:hypothetical protein